MSHLPKKSQIRIKIEDCEFDKNNATCTVIKDGGDDPDVTHGAEIRTQVTLTEKPGEIEIDGGEGVGRVTKPGLGLEIGSAAINPTPKKMIRENILEIAKDILAKNGIKVMISVPKGRRACHQDRQSKTWNHWRHFNSWNKWHSGTIFHSIFCSIN